VIRLQNIMETNVDTVAPEEPAERAWTRMRQAGIHHLVVLQDGKVTGVVSSRDLGGPKGAATRRDRTVADLMTPHAVCAARDTTIRAAANLMRGRSIGCLPVLDRGRLVGIVTVADLLEALGRGLHVPDTGSRPVLDTRGPRRRPFGRGAARP
jgi:CBS domain-containing protein